MPGEVGRQHVELEVALGDDLVGDLLAALVAALARLPSELVEALALHVEHLAERLGDLLVHAAEVVALELVAPAPAQPLHEVAHAHDLLVVPVAEALLHHAAQRRVQVAVVEQVVGDLLEHRLGVEVEADLRAVPLRVPEPRRASHRGHPYCWSRPLRRASRRPAPARLRGCERTSSGKGGWARGLTAMRTSSKGLSSPGDAVGAELVAAGAAVDEHPLAVAAHGDGDRLHARVALGDARSPGRWSSTCLLVRHAGQWLRWAVPGARIDTSRRQWAQRKDSARWWGRRR